MNCRKIVGVNESTSITVKETNPTVTYKNDVAQLQDECNRHLGSDHAYGVPDAEKRAKDNITRWVQTKLNGLGYNYSMIDDDFGNNTKTGVIAYQRANSFAADGIIKPKNT